jgi:hypothetical protein
MRAQPTIGRYFPIAVSRVVALTRDWPLGDGTSSESRRLRNPSAQERDSLRLVRLRPGRDLTVYSLPTVVDARVGERAITRAIEVLARWKAAPVESVDGRSRSLVVYLEDRTELRIVDERLKFARRKFGAGEGLSSSRQPRVTSRTMTELARVPLRDAG